MRKEGRKAEREREKERETRSDYLRNRKIYVLESNSVVYEIRIFYQIRQNLHYLRTTVDTV